MRLKNVRYRLSIGTDLNQFAILCGADDQKWANLGGHAQISCLTIKPTTYYLIFRISSMEF